MSVITEISEFLQKVRMNNVKELVTKDLADGVPAREILNDGLIAGMMIIGEKFKNNQVYV
ncbi:MAG: cobalamin-binding protein, partial [Clostridiales bacterium]|nr:cobalamin-binding protein [Clostridiales bacterium]